MVSPKTVQDALDPATRRCCFTVIRWKQTEIATPQKPQTLRLHCAVLDDDSSFPLTHDLTPYQQQRAPEPVDGHPGAIAVARRIATITHGVIRMPDMSEVKTRRWRHGKPETWNVALLCEPAINALTAAARWSALPPPEPGNNLWPLGALPNPQPPPGLRSCARCTTAEPAPNTKRPGVQTQGRFNFLLAKPT
jgi:hypothetical protein